jgi:outer membrane immunogenic protein
MKKIALIAFLLAVCVAAGRAQESRQDISLSGTGLIEPFIGSSTDVYVSANRAFGALLSYRFMLTPSSALEANYGITYENNIHYKSNSVYTTDVLTRTQEISAAYVRTFSYRKFNPFV